MKKFLILPSLTAALWSCAKPDDANNRKQMQARFSEPSEAPSAIAEANLVNSDSECSDPPCGNELDR